MNDWISVEDKLPESGDFYLIALRRKTQPPRVMQGRYSSTARLFYIGAARCKFGEVTHWMPLPEPPKQQD